MPCGADFHHALHALLTGERSGYYVDFGSVEDLSKALRQGFVFDGRYSRYRGRTHGRLPLGLKGNQMVKTGISICCAHTREFVHGLWRGHMPAPAMRR